MSNSDFYNGVIEALLQVAPDLDADSIAPDAHLMNDLGIDSMDYLNFIIALHKRYQVNIPESDYRLISSAAQAATYLEQHQG